MLSLGQLCYWFLLRINITLDCVVTVMSCFYRMMRSKGFQVLQDSTSWEVGEHVLAQDQDLSQGQARGFLEPSTGPHQEVFCLVGIIWGEEERNHSSMHKHVLQGRPMELWPPCLAPL